MRKVLPLLAALVLLPAGTASAGGAFVYSTGGGKFWQFTAGAGGALAALSPPSVGTPGSTEATAMLERPDQTRLFAPFAGSTPVVWSVALGSSGTGTGATSSSTGSGSGPEGAALSPDGQSYYLADRGSGVVRQYTVTASGTLSVKVPSTVTVSTPRDVVVSPDGTTAYVAAAGLDTVDAFDIATGGDLTAKAGAGATAPVTAAPARLAMTPDGRVVLVAIAGKVTSLAVGAGGTLTATGVYVAGAANPLATALTPDGRHLYVADGAAGSLYLYDIGADGHLAAHAPATVTAAGTDFYGVAVDPGGHTLYATVSGAVLQYAIDAAGSLAPLSPASAPTSGVPAGAISVSPDVNASAGFSAAVAPAGTASTFDASASVDQDGHPASYDWDFGDGTTLAAAGAAPSHVYTAAGTYTVTVRVTDDRGCAGAAWNGHEWLCQGGQPTASLQVDVAAGPPPPPPLLAPLFRAPTGGAAKLARTGSPKLTAAKGRYRLDTGIGLKCPITTSPCGARISVTLLRHGKKPLGGLTTSALDGRSGTTTAVVVAVASKRTAVLKALAKAKLTIQVGGLVTGGTGAQDQRTVTIKVPKLTKAKKKATHHR